jgi:hypothetical protein
MVASGVDIGAGVVERIRLRVVRVGNKGPCLPRRRGIKVVVVGRIFFLVLVLVLVLKLVVRRDRRLGVLGQDHLAR